MVPTLMINSVITRTLLIILALTAYVSGVERPNILWITSEDNSPFLGCYGDELANSPNIDGLAENGVLYRNAYSTAAVCGPARTV